MTHDGVREELRALRTVIEGFANRDPKDISFMAAQHLAVAAEYITNALDHAVSSREMEELRRSRV